MIQPGESECSRATPDDQAKPDDQAAEASRDVSASGLLATIEQLIAQIRGGLDASMALGQVEFALFRMGMLRMFLMSIAVVGLLLSLWLVMLIGSFALLFALTGSQLAAFSLLIALIAITTAVLGIGIRRWYRISFFPRLRRQIDATLSQWQEPT